MRRIIYANGGMKVKRVDQNVRNDGIKSRNKNVHTNIDYNSDRQNYTV